MEAAGPRAVHAPLAGQIGAGIERRTVDLRTMGSEPARRKIAWLCLQGLGDSLMATPAIAAMKELRPDWDIHVVTSQQDCYKLFAEHPAVSRTHIFRFWSLGYGAVLRDLPRLALEHFDASLLAYPAVRREYHLLAFAIGAARRVAHRSGAGPAGLDFLSTVLVDPQLTHNVVNNVNLLAAVGLAQATPAPGYSVPPSWRKELRKRGAIGVHVGSMTYKGNELKRWPLERQVALGRKLRAQGYRLSYIAGPKELDETQFVRGEVDAAAPLICAPIDDVARALSEFSLVISPDNGIAHLAAAVGTPTVALFGPTDPVRCAPWGAHATSVRPSDCPPCFDTRDRSFTCKRQIGARCIREDLTVEDVARAATLALERSGDAGAASRR